MDYCEAYGQKEVVETYRRGLFFEESSHEAVPENQRFVNVVLVEEETAEPSDAEDP